ncbi:hypothetical protein WG947_09725 [Pontibacter sp. H259]|uniref:hypothetical protein n=1 Tax=Pontibacter sp. H259 TaxID=3133421 RepID=UPI0030BAC6DF
MQENIYPFRPRYYQNIIQLLQEDEQDISEEGMRRRCTALSILQDYIPLPANPNLMPSADGALKGIIFTIPDYAFKGENNPIWDAYKDLLRKLPVYTKLYLLAHESIVTELQQWLAENGLLERAALKAVPQYYEITIWAEDGFELVKEESTGEIFLMQPHSHRRTSDGNIGYRISKAYDWKLAKVPLYFEGGNLLAGDDFILLGADHAVETYHDWSGNLMDTDQDISKSIANEYKRYLDKNRKVYFIGCQMQLPPQHERNFKLNGEDWKEQIFMKNREGAVQPIFHIDMFITLAGRNPNGNYQLVVGDPRMAATILNHHHDKLFLPDAFDEIAETLSRLGFEVIRNPLPLVYVDDPKQKLRKWYFASYNNALIEIKSETEKTIWLPTYGYGTWTELQATDKENQRIWQQLGFRVIPLADFHPFAENAGSVHCIKNYIR